jgi:RNA methyltransferase, TrmH family
LTRNSLESLIRDLHRRRGRERRGLALAEGVRLVEEALAARVPIRGAAVSPTLEATARGQALLAALAAAGVPLERVDDDALAKLADTEQPQGVVAVVVPPAWSLEQVAPTGADVVVVLDAVQDPGNVGTILRTAHALGAAAVVALPGTAELTSPKTLRAAMGAFFRFPCISTGTEAFLDWASAVGAETWVTDAAGTPIASTPRSGHPLALVLGNEGAGVGEAVRARAARQVAVPLRPGAESLNVAIAAAILLYEVRRGS